MAHSFVSLAARFTLASPIPLRANSLRLPKPARTLSRHCTEAGQSEKAAGLWGKAASVAGAFSVGRSHRTALTRARPDRDLARHSRAASRAD